MIDVSRICHLCKAALEEHYGSRLYDIVVYGSCARGQCSPESDIDLLVVLKDDFDYFQELSDIVNVLYPVQLQSEMLISAKPVRRVDYENGLLQLYRNARTEGVSV